MGVTLERRDEASRVQLEGTVDIAAAAELKTALQEAVRAGREVHVALDEVRYLDVTAVQLLWAAGREARTAGVGFLASGALPEPARAALRDAGLDLFPEEPD